MLCAPSLPMSYAASLPSGFCRGGAVDVLPYLRRWLVPPAVRNVLRQGRYDQLETLMMSGAAQGMQTAEMAEGALRARGVLA